MNDSADRPLPAALPLDLRRGLTDAADAAHPLRWGILGAGSIATQWVEALAACAGATVTARDRSRAEQFAARFATAYGDYAEMVAAPDVDIVYVGTITCWGSSTQNVKFRLRADLDQWLAEHGITTRRPAAGAPPPHPNSSGKGCWRNRLRRAESAPELPRDFHHKGSTVLDTWFNMHVLADVGVEAVLDSARVVNTEQSFSAFQQSPDVHGAGCDELQIATVSCVGGFA